MISEATQVNNDFVFDTRIDFKFSFYNRFVKSLQFSAKTLTDWLCFVFCVTKIDRI